MKKLFFISLILLVAQSIYAQTIPGHNTDKPKATIVIVTHNNEYLLDSGYFKFITNKVWTEYIIAELPSPKNDTSKYGRNAVNGVDILLIDDEHYPDLYIEIKKGLSYIGPADIEAIEKSKIKIKNGTVSRKQLLNTPNH